MRKHKTYQFEVESHIPLLKLYDLTPLYKWLSVCFNLILTLRSLLIIRVYTTLELVIVLISHTWFGSRVEPLVPKWPLIIRFINY